MDTSQYLGIFLDESKEHLQLMNDGLLSLEKDPTHQESLENIFRAAHTLKGMSATMGFTEIAEFTHAIENVLDQLRHGKLTVTPETMDILFRCLDVLEDFVEDIAADRPSDQDITPLVASLQKLQGGSARDGSTQDGSAQTPAGEGAGGRITGSESLAKVVLTDTERDFINQGAQRGEGAFYVFVQLQENCALKSARSYLVLRRMEENGEVIKTFPSSEELEAEKFDLSFAALYLTALNEEEIQTELMSVAEVAEVKVTSFDPAEEGWAPQEDAQQGEMSAAGVQAQTAEAGSVAAVVAAAIPQNGQKQANNGHSNGNHAIRQTIRVDIEKLDSLMNLVGELVINRSRLAQIGLAAKVAVLNEGIEELARITTELQGVVMKARMVPIDQVFNRFPRMVRDLARELGKEIELVIEGGETELDRTVVDEIGDPLVHLLRNAVDHGIESPDERRKLNKPAAGLVRLAAKHEGNQVVVQLTDDGHGIDLEKVRTKAINTGFLSAEEADEVDEEELMGLLFNAGFSTAEKITEVSGRGVGLDVVRSKIQALNGSVSVENEPGKGSVFTIKLPLTLAIIQALLVRVGADEVYALPLENIEEIVNIHVDSIKTIQHQEHLLFRGQVIPIFRMSTLFETPEPEAPKPYLNVVVVRTGNKRYGLVVDRLIGQQEVVIKSLDSMFSQARGFAGATILGDGKVALILDVLNLIV
ncbi:MAG: chemotaxis protein CheA [Firmicutes bacterium]|nr:chemotaxis protein CheA [Bacillota bacterium]